MFLKLCSENKLSGFPANLNDTRSKSSNQTSDDTSLIKNAIERLEYCFVDQLQQFVGSQYQKFHSRLQVALNQFESTGQNLYFKPKFQGDKSERAISEIVQSNYRILSSIRELIYSTRYPRTHDKASLLKKAVDNVVELLELRAQFDQKRMVVGNAIGTILGKLETAKEIIMKRQMHRVEDAIEILEDQHRTVTSLPRLEPQWRTNILNIIKMYTKQLMTLKKKKGNHTRRVEQRHGVPMHSPISEQPS